MTNGNSSFPRETVEFVPLSVTDGTTPVTAYSTAILPYRIRPQISDWVPAVTIAGEHGFMVTGLSRNTYGVWVRIVASPETIVISPDDPSGPGYITVT